MPIYTVIDTRTGDSAGDYEAATAADAIRLAHEEVGSVDCGPGLDDLEIRPTAQEIADGAEAYEEYRVASAHRGIGS